MSDAGTWDESKAACRDPEGHTLNLTHEILILFLHSRKITEVACISVFPLPQRVARLGWPQGVQVCSSSSVVFAEGSPKLRVAAHWAQPMCTTAVPVLLEQQSPPHPRLLFASTRLQHKPSFLRLCLHHCSISFFPVKQLGTLVAQATVTLQCKEPTEATTLELFHFFALRKKFHAGIP